MDQLDYFQNHPPRCIGGFIARPTLLKAIQLDGHLSKSQLSLDPASRVATDAPEHLNPVFALSCQCHNNEHLVHCYRWVNEDFNNEVVTLSPLALECAACQKTTELLDTDVHGYDAEWGHGSATVRAQGHRWVYECANCGEKALETFARFEYPDDLFDGNLSKYVGREQDFFTWFTLVAKCTTCAHVFCVADFECA